jgi:hypothetical protein
MQVTNQQYFKGYDFATYQQLPGHSYSSIKGGTFAATPKMQLGTSVHNFLLEPEKYDHSNREIVYPIANVLMQHLGDVIKFMDTELSVTCDMTCEGFTMAYRGRIDMALIDKMVIDLKVSEIPLNRSVPFFGYANQLTGYCLATSCTHAMIVRVCPKTYKVEKTMIRLAVDWWHNKVLELGIPTNIFNHTGSGQPAIL